MNPINRPNYNINRSNHTYRYLGDNNLRRTFIDCFDIILSSCYNDDTKSSRYYNKIKDDRTSAYYIHQPELENQLGDFLKSPIDKDTFLVGFTGIGKTTLIKNFFGILDANPFITPNGELIAYLSVHADDITNTTDIDDLFASFSQSIINCLKKFVDFDLSSNKDAQDFYEFVNTYKDRLINSRTPFDDKRKSKRTLLKDFFDRDSTSFYSMLIKFLVDKINFKKQSIDKIVLIFDDIESQRINMHIPFISKAMNMSACLRNLHENRTFVVKSLISLRAYTFRYHYARQAEAKRASFEEDVILKDSIPAMKDIFEKRFNVYYENDDVKKAIPNEKRWIDSKTVLMEVVNNLADFGDMISSLAHYDISHSLKLFLRVITNKRWFAPTENYYQGSFETPNLETYTLSTKQRVFKALFYSENEVFVDSDDNILPNILSIHEEDEPNGLELLSLYILEHMLFLERSKQITLYGTKKIAGNILCNKISTILNGDAELQKKIQHVIGRLYQQQYLLHSIFEPENDNTDKEHEFNRNFDPNYGLYLSIRGKKVLEMLENDSMLFEVFRDDIDTDLPNNTCLTTRMNQKDKHLYLISYCKQLFEIEKRYIAHSNQREYFRCFGKRFIVSRLIIGIQNSIKYFYKTDEVDYIVVKSALENLINDMLTYRKDLLNKSEDIEHKMIDSSFIDKNLFP